MANTSYIIASAQEWHRQRAIDWAQARSGTFDYVSTPDELAARLASQTAPDYIFFLHWSEIVPKNILQDYRCVCFHMTDVPYGRGGSPLQNLILRGHTDTKLTALQMNEQLDAGPVYLKRDLSLEGSAYEIYQRAGDVSLQMAGDIIDNDIKPVPQEGEATTFRRRRPEESDLTQCPEDVTPYDFIRMLDAPGYPKAFLKGNGWRVEFSEAGWEAGDLTAVARFIRDEEN